MFKKERGKTIFRALPKVQPVCQRTLFLPTTQIDNNKRLCFPLFSPAFGKGKAASLSLYNKLYSGIARLEWRTSPEPLQLCVPPHCTKQNCKTYTTLTSNSTFAWLASCLIAWVSHRS